ncbi:MAG TPA: PEGA domain-containing protein [Longimicrobiaceae bacterium]|nr:PEGA domain-containing protein [Longimicrobiaceae bacterium]
MSRKPCVFLLLSVLGLSSCATIVNGSRQEVAISSTPTGATVTVDNQQHGVTPVTLDLTRKDHHTVRLDLQGYEPYEVQLTRKTSGWVWGNLVFGGLIGLAVDAIGGGMYKLSPEAVNAELARSTAMRRGDGLHVIVVLTPDPAWEKIGQLERSPVSFR